MNTKTGADQFIKQVYVYLCVDDGCAAIEFYQQAFNAVEIYKLVSPNGEIAHAELRLGPTTLMIADEHPEIGVKSPKSYGGSGVTIHLHVDNADKLLQQAVEVGGENTICCKRSVLRRAKWSL